MAQVLLKYLFFHLKALHFVKTSLIVPEYLGSPGGGHGTHSSVLAWRILWTEECAGLQSTGLQRVGQDEVTQHTHTHKQMRYLLCIDLELLRC